MDWKETLFDFLAKFKIRRSDVKVQIPACSGETESLLSNRYVFLDEAGVVSSTMNPRARLGLFSTGFEERKWMIGLFHVSEAERYQDNEAKGGEV